MPLARDFVFGFLEYRNLYRCWEVVLNKRIETPQTFRVEVTSHVPKNLVKIFVCARRRNNVCGRRLYKPED
jgi:hypothetical protein